MLAANDVEIRIDSRDGYTPTPALSHAILAYNRGRTDGLADGIVVTPSHNPPTDGGFKYNPPDGGPASSEATGWIQDRANEIIAEGMAGVKRIPLATALAQDSTGTYDFLDAYARDLPNVLNLDAVRDAGLKVGADPMGGAAVAYYGYIAEMHGLDLTVVNPKVDPTWRFMTLDWDGKIRMDCSSPYAMASLVALKDQYRVAFGNDADADRHGIVTPGAGLMNPNHYLAVAIQYLYANRPGWRADAAVGKTLVSSSMIDRVAADLGRRLVEVPVGFKWFVPGLVDGSFGFGGEESAGASFLRKDGTVWTTDKDGVLLTLLSAEITAVTGKDPSEHYAELDRPARRAGLRPGRRTGQPRGEGQAGQPLPGPGHRHRAGRRDDHREAHRGARQRGEDRRPEGDDRERLVRRPPVGHRGRLQDLRRVLPRGRAPRPDPERGPRRGLGRPRVDRAVRRARIPGAPQTVAQQERLPVRRTPNGPVTRRSAAGT